MKRSWIGFFLLAALLAGSLWASRTMVTIHTENAEVLEKAARCALGGDWAGAAYLTAQAEHDWEKWELFRSAMADHNPSEEIDALFAAMKVYGSAREQVAFASLCREISEKMQAIGDAHNLKFRNLL